MPHASRNGRRHRVSVRRAREPVGGLETRQCLSIAQLAGDTTGGGARLGQQRVIPVEREQRGGRAQKHRRIADRTGQCHGGAQIRERLLMAVQGNQRLGARLQPGDLILDASSFAALLSASSARRNASSQRPRARAISARACASRSLQSQPWCPCAFAAASATSGSNAVVRPISCR